LIQLVEQGIGLQKAKERIHELERERLMLERELSKANAVEVKRVDFKRFSGELANLLLNFEGHFSKQLLREQKQMLRAFVSGVLVERGDKTIAVCYIRKLPLVPSF